MWSVWRLRREDGGLGWPKHVAFFKQNMGGGFWTPEMDSACLDVDKAVCALNDELKEAVIICYCGIGTKEDKSRRLGCCVRTYDNRLKAGEKEILGLLNDLAAGIPMRVQTSGQREAA